MEVAADNMKVPAILVAILNFFKIILNDDRFINRILIMGTLGYINQRLKKTTQNANNNNKKN